MAQTLMNYCASDAISDAATKDALGLAYEKCRTVYNMDLLAKTVSLDDWSRWQIRVSYELQLLETLLMFLSILILISAGLWFCYLEFKRNADAVSTIKIGPTTLEISSKLFGILILFFSLGFAYIFFDKAYSISVASSDQTPKATSESSSQTGG